MNPSRPALSYPKQRETKIKPNQQSNQEKDNEKEETQKSKQPKSRFYHTIQYHLRPYTNNRHI